MGAVYVVDGFSTLNRGLLYASLMLAPAQYISGIGSNSPTNIGFLAYNWYTQLKWYSDVRSGDLRALSLVLPHFNMIYAFTYVAGISSGNWPMGLVLGLGSAGVLALNTTCAWTAWARNDPEGFGVYQFFFFGWRTLNPDWQKFILCWQISDSILAFGAAITCIIGGLRIPSHHDTIDERESRIKKIATWRYLAIPVGAAVVMLVAWPLIMWTELIIQRNHIESQTDWTAVWLFIAQVGTLFLPHVGYDKVKNKWYVRL